MSTHNKEAPLTDAEIEYRFLKDLVESQRLAVYKAFGVYGDDWNMRLNRGIERRPLKAILNRRSALTASVAPATEQAPPAATGPTCMLTGDPDDPGFPVIEFRSEQAPAGEVLQILTGAFVGLTITLARQHGADDSKEIKIDGGSSRDITIHASKIEEQS